MKTKIIATLLFMSFISIAKAVTVESLIKTYGKEAIMQAISSKVHNKFTIYVNETFKEAYAPSIDFITTTTLETDISRAGMTIKSVEKLCLNKEPTAKQTEKLIDNEGQQTKTWNERNTFKQNNSQQEPITNSQYNQTPHQNSSYQWIHRRSNLLIDQTATRKTFDGHKRSHVAKNDFKKQNPCPSNGNNQGPCPGYVIDHIIPIVCNGDDTPSNMQWQSISEGKAKDRWERKNCQISNFGNHNITRSSRRNSYSSDKFRNALFISNRFVWGPRGGCIEFSENGKKRYVDHSFCF